MASFKQEESSHKAKRKRENLKTFVHTSEDLSNKKRCIIDSPTTIWINKNEDEELFRKTYFENKAIYEAAHNTSRFGGKKARNKTD